MNLTEKIHVQFHIYEAAVTLKNHQGHQNWYEWIELNTGNNHAKSWKVRLTRGQENINNNVFVRSGNMSIIYLEVECMLNPKIALCA